MQKQISKNSFKSFLFLFFIGTTIFLYSPLCALAENVNYKYDSAGRLTQVNYGNGQSITYAYDKAGNLLKKIVKKSNIILMIVPVISGAEND